MLLSSCESECLIDTELDKSGVLMVFFRLFEEKLCSFFVKFRNGFWWQIGVLSHNEGTKESID